MKKIMIKFKDHTLYFEEEHVSVVDKYIAIYTDRNCVTYFLLEEIESVSIDTIVFAPWKDETGRIHLARENGCVFCKHCTDIFLDPLRGNEIYSSACNLSLEPSMNCKSFEKE